MTVYGYMRISTKHQKFDSQKKALLDYGVDKIVKEQESGRNEDRPLLSKLLKKLKKGDTLVIFKLDRLARSTQQLLFILDGFEKKEIHFVSIQNDIDTSTPMGKFFFTIMSAFSEMESAIIRERVVAGLTAAKENGKILGRPPLTNERKYTIELFNERNLTPKEIASQLGIGLSTVYQFIKEEKSK